MKTIIQVGLVVGLLASLSGCAYDPAVNGYYGRSGTYYGYGSGYGRSSYSGYRYPGNYGYSSVGDYGYGQPSYSFQGYSQSPYNGYAGYQGAYCPDEDDDD